MPCCKSKNNYSVYVCNSKFQPNAYYCKTHLIPTVFSNFSIDVNDKITSCKLAIKINYTNVNQRFVRRELKVVKSSQALKERIAGGWDLVEVGYLLAPDYPDLLHNPSSIIITQAGSVCFGLRKEK